ncbi:MAG: lipopolysaccharide biosynthesis protein [Lachnospiraceae bacterium]|nr:lipopolysaccharide biosynthesis protein [Lachnospiraceae bacterium]
MYALAAVLLSVISLRLLGPDDGGIFGFGYSTFGQQMFIIAYFGIRPFHITDVRHDYSYTDYRAVRWKTCILSVLFAFLYLLFFAVSGKYSTYKSACIFLIALIKVVDGFADCLESECQRDGFLWRGGRELFIRTVIMVAVFSLSVILTKKLLVSAAAAVISETVTVVIFSLRLKGEKSFPVSERKREQEKKLMGDTVLLFISVFIDFFVFSSSKYAIDIKLYDSASGIFNILFMPTSVIYMASNFIMKPYLTKMAAMLENDDTKGFRKTERNIALSIAGLTVLCVLMVVFLGKWALTIVEKLLGENYTGSLTPRVPELILIMAGGGLYAMADLLYYVLVIKRKQKSIFFVYLVVGVLSAVISFILVGSWGITGAAVSYTAVMSILTFGYLIVQ